MLSLSLSLFLHTQLYHSALDRALRGTSPLSRFLRWFESDSPELELQRYQLGLFKEQCGLERVVVDEEGKTDSKDDERDDHDESNLGDPHKEK